NVLGSGGVDAKHQKVVRFECRFKIVAECFRVVLKRWSKTLIKIEQRDVVISRKDKGICRIETLHKLLGSPELTSAGALSNVTRKDHKFGSQSFMECNQGRHRLLDFSPKVSV